MSSNSVTNVPTVAQVPMAPHHVPLAQFNQMNSFSMPHAATNTQFSMAPPQAVPQQYYHDSSVTNFSNGMHLNQPYMWQAPHHHDVSGYSRMTPMNPTRYAPYSPKFPRPTDFPTVNNTNWKSQNWQTQHMPQVPAYPQPTSSAVMSLRVPSQQVPVSQMNCNPVEQTSEQQPVKPSKTVQQDSWNSAQMDRLNKLIQETSEDAPGSSTDCHPVMPALEESAEQPVHFECTDEQNKAMAKWFQKVSQKKWISQFDRLKLAQATGIPDKVILDYIRTTRKELRIQEKTRITEILTKYYESTSSSQEPEEVAKQTGLTLDQVNGWLSNKKNWDNTVRQVQRRQTCRITSPTHSSTSASSQVIEPVHFSQSSQVSFNLEKPEQQPSDSLETFQQESSESCELGKMDCRPEMHKPKEFECTEEQKEAMATWFEEESHRKSITQKHRMKLTEATGIPDKIILEYVKSMRRKICYKKRSSSETFSICSTSSQELAERMSATIPTPDSSENALKENVSVLDKGSLDSTLLEHSQGIAQQASEKEQLEEHKLLPSEIDDLFDGNDGDIFNSFDSSLFGM